MNHRIYIPAWLLLLATTVIGCAADEPAVVSTPAAAPASAKGDKTASPRAERPESATVADAAAQPPPVEEFAPPFPDRMELFEAPKRAQSTVRRDDEHGEMVELKGFVNVDTPRVVLSIDGVISPIPEGGEKYGVHVISIQPPSVVLQRGRNRWTATLE
jgi:hypothetical protein